MNCLNCTVEMRGRDQTYWYECEMCGYLASDLPVNIAGSVNGDVIDEARRRESLSKLREENFERILDALDSLRKVEQRRLLDVGCAHGWFLDAARRRGYDAVGLEPDLEIAAQARQRGHRVVHGFFPEDLGAGDCFDLITFHDVFEHLPDPNGAARAAYDRLAPNGLLVLNLPSSHGALFRFARTLDRFGFRKPLDRMWQEGFPSPHLSYFHPAILASLLEPIGFREVFRGALPSFTKAGLWQRIRYDRSSSVLYSAGVWAGLYLAAPLLRFLPADISLQVFCRTNEGGERVVAA